jgi:hypothetical protein
MGCGSSSLKRELAEEAEKDEEIDNIQDLLSAVESTWELFGKLANNPSDKRFWPTFTRLVRLFRKQSEWTQSTTPLDACIPFLEMLTKDSVAPGCGTPRYLWSLSTMGQVKLERFRISNESNDVDDAINYFVLHAEISQRTDLDVTVPLSDALKASYEKNDTSEVLEHEYILQSIWPKVKDAKVGSYAFRYLSFLWRVQYMQRGDVFSLLACRAVTRAFIFAPETKEDDLEAALQDLIDIDMAVYFVIPNISEFPDVALPPRVASKAQETAVEMFDSSLTAKGDVVDQMKLYAPLEIRQIRVVELEAGEYNAHIRCRVVVASLNSDPIFDASWPFLVESADLWCTDLFIGSLVYVKRE